MGIKAYRQETRLRYRHPHFLSRHGCRVDVIQAVVFEICHASDTSEGSEAGFSSEKTRPEVPINRQMFRSHRLVGTHDRNSGLDYIAPRVCYSGLRGSSESDYIRLFSELPASFSPPMARAIVRRSAAASAIGIRGYSTADLRNLTRRSPCSTSETWRLEWVLKRDQLSAGIGN